VEERFLGVGGTLVKKARVYQEEGQKREEEGLSGVVIRGDRTGLEWGFD